MKIEFKNLPIDLLSCLIWSLIIIPLLLLEIKGGIRVVIGLPIIVLIPGYVLTFALIPSKKITFIERIAVSLGLSLVVSALVAFGLFYTPWGIELEPILITMYLFIVGVGFFGWHRWAHIKQKERHFLSFNLSPPKFQNNLDKILTVILAVSMIFTSVYFVYVLQTPKAEEKFTEFYWLGPEGIAGQYQRNLSIGEDTSIILGISNHEYTNIDYTIEVWLINQTITYNKSTKENDAIINNMSFMDKFVITLDHTNYGIKEMWKPQWERSYTFNVKQQGEFELVFLMYTEPTEEYNYNQNYADIAQAKLGSAYMEIHLQLVVK